MNNKRKNRPAPARPQRGRSIVPAQGVYNNSFFMHAATSFVGNLVQVQTHSGSIYEGVFKTFSPKFEVAIELAQCIKGSNQNQKNDDTNSLAECIVFHPNHIVSIVAKEVDPEFATGGTFQTDSAIVKCNGLSRIEEKELEPWVPSGGSVNGDTELQLDGKGWDANDMFNKNETLYGVQSTFDSSLAGYTVAIEKKDTQEFKIAEAEAEKIAQEIESNPSSKERLNLENGEGDEETRFAAVDRSADQNQDLSPISSNSNTMSKGNHNVEKYVLPSKRKTMQTGKLVRSTPPPNNNNGPLPQHTHNNSKNNNFQSMQMQNTTSYQLNQNYTHMHGGHSSNLSQSKINGEGNNNNNNSKPLPQRSIRQFQSSNAAVSYSNPSPSMSGQVSMGKPPVHVGHNHSQNMSNQHISSSNMQENPSSTQTGNIMYPSVVQMSSSPAGPSPQPQRTPRARDETIQEFRQFQKDFHLVASNPQSQAKTPSVSPQQQQPQPSISPPQSHQQLSPMSQTIQTSQHHNHHQQHQQQQQQQSQSSLQQQVQQQTPPQQMQAQPPPPQQVPAVTSQSLQQQQASQQHSQQQQLDNSVNLQLQKNSQMQAEQQNYQTTGTQQQSPPTIISPNTSCSSISSTATATPPQPPQSCGNPSSNNGGNESGASEKIQPSPAVVKKTHQLNPAAKPFTPRSPSTPTASRPHTPQTPGPTMTPGVYTPGPHLSAGQLAYVMPPQPSFQTAPHPHAGQQRIRRAPLAAPQMQVSAATATGQPLLTTAPLQQFMHYQQSPHPTHFQSQPYPPMVRMYHEPPPQQIQFLAQTPPSTTPSPGQPHQPFHPGPQPSPAGGGPPAFGPATQPGPHFQMMYPVIASHPHLVPNYCQGAAQTPHHAQQFQVIMQQQHPAP